MEYRVRAFAEKSGVTVKALHHYERLGLLRPGRTTAGYRVYSKRDLERLEQILALKMLGVPLRQIKPLLEQTAHFLPDALRAQRVALEDQQALLSRAIRAIEEAEAAIRCGRQGDSTIFRRIIEVIQMHDSVDAMKKYYSAAAWERHRRYYENGPSEEWLALYRDANALLAEDPGGSAAQGLGDRWLALSLRAYNDDADAQTDSPAAWMDRENWPEAIKRRAAELNLEEVRKFLEIVVTSGRKQYFDEEEWKRFTEFRRRAAEDPIQASRLWQERVDLFQEIDSTGVEAGELARRWMASLDAESGGDTCIKESLMAAWADRRNWPATVRWHAEGLTRLTGDRFERAADLIDRALQFPHQ